MEYERPVRAEINLDTISRNIQEIKKLLPANVLFMAVVKADAYGHGAIKVSREAIKCGADRLGVALPEEGIALRKAGIKVPIQILGEIHPSASEIVLQNDLISTICSKNVADAISAQASNVKKKAIVHVKIDTGMNRLGLLPVDAAEFLEYARGLPFLEIEGIFTHFACADNPKSSHTKQQLQKFQNVLSDLSRRGFDFSIKHAANSAATIFYPETHFDMVRIGIAMYGLHPSDATKSRINLEPVLSLISSVSQMKPLSAGKGVSYSLTFKPTRKSKIALLPLGYADGYSRLLSNKAEVLIKGGRAPIVGNICMDQSLVDVTGIENVQVGDKAVLIGKQNAEEILADDIAKILGTINYEVTCMISRRVPRLYYK